MGRDDLWHRRSGRSLRAGCLRSEAQTPKFADKPSRPVHEKASSVSFAYLGPRQSRLAEFFQVDVSVTQRGLQGAVAEYVCDQLQTGATPMSIRGPGVPKDMSPTGSNSTSLKTTPNHVAHA